MSTIYCLCQEHLQLGKKKTISPKSGDCLMRKMTKPVEFTLTYAAHATLEKLDHDVDHQESQEFSYSTCQVKKKRCCGDS